jgi:hypothetical protein
VVWGGPEALARLVVLGAEAALAVFRCLLGKNAAAEELWE